jgi:thymidylate synthase
VAPSLPPWLAVDRRLLARYVDRFTDVRSRRGVRYAYGPRLRRYRGRDQLDGMRAELAAYGESRRAVAVLWDPPRDAGEAHPPCLVALQARLRGGALHLVAYLRSSDLYRAWPYNAFGLRRLQARLAEDVGAARAGELVTVAGSAHVYEECWPAARALLEGEGERLERLARFVRDPRGSFVVRLEAEEIVVDHYAPDGSRLAGHRGRSAAALRPRLAPFLSLPAHALYLGGELERAETALRLDLPYVQDAAVGPVLASPPRA